MAINSHSQSTIHHSLITNPFIQNTSIFHTTSHSLTHLFSPLQHHLLTMSPPPSAATSVCHSSGGPTTYHIPQPAFLSPFDEFFLPSLVILSLPDYRCPHRPDHLCSATTPRNCLRPRLVAAFGAQLPPSLRFRSRFYSIELW